MTTLEMQKLPILPIRDKVVFPNVITILAVGRDRSIAAVKAAMAAHHLIFVVSQRHNKVEDPQRADLFDIGTVAEVIQTTQLPDGILRIRISGRHRARLLDLTSAGGYSIGDIQAIDTPSIENEKPLELEAARRVLVKKFDDYSQRHGRIPIEVISAVEERTSLEEVTDLVADAMFIGLEEKQDLLETTAVSERMNRVIEILDSEIEILSIEKKIQNRVHKQIEKNQREYYLQEQMRAIQKELKKKDDVSEEVDNYRKKIAELKMTQEAEEAALKELSRLEKMPGFSPEATVVRSYLEWITALPWSTRSEDVLDVEKAKKMLDEDHYGLEKPKERLLEYMAVLKLTKNIRGPVLCFVGPPGTGKTSLAKSLAKAMGRQFIRISLGGVRDESEIRGHRRTYIGSLPGRIIQSLKKVKTKNPIILLDEIDKMGNDWRGDPAAALLEVLDPEQNKAFVDHFLEVGFDLSEVIFVATANTLYTIPATLQDRLEVIRYSAYTTEEKVHIANRFILPKELKEHGLPDNAITFADDVLRKLIHLYTQEAGVRELQRKIGKICRKVAVEWVKNQAKNKLPESRKISLPDLTTYLGQPEYIREKISVNSVGIATGLAWTEHGGETLTIEVTMVPGQGKVMLTGKLGAVMQESAQTALSLIKSYSKKLGVADSLFKKNDIHIHLPEGAVPKDGPSAGIALATAIASTFTNKPIRKNLAMTGEVTLRGRVLPIGGLKEKVLAAYREGITDVLFPVGNEKDLSDIPEKVKKDIKLIPVKVIDDVFQAAFQSVGLKISSPTRKSISLPHAN